jgi:DNA gyrase/topoisomerase IV subunit A
MSSHDAHDAAVELESVRTQLQIYEAVAAAANDPHSILDAISGSPDSDGARRALQEHFGFSEVQALAVMDMQFRRLTAIDRERNHQRRRELEAAVVELDVPDSQRQRR